MGSWAKIFKIVLLVIAVSVIVLLASLFAFVKSPLFAKAVTSAINNYTGLRVEIGSLSVREGNRIIVDNLMVRQKQEDGFLLELPHAEISARLRGIIRKHIDDIILIKPVIALTYKKDKKGKPSLPFTFNRISVTDADVMVRFEKDKALHISALSVSLDRKLSEKNSSLTGSAFVGGIDSRISVTAEVDLDRFDFVKARAEIAPVDLSKAVDLYPLAFLEDKELKGMGKLFIEMERSSDAGDSSIRYQASMSVQDFLFRSQKMGVDLKDRLLALESHGIFDPEHDNADIATLTFQLSTIPLLSLHGSVKRLSSDAPVIDIAAAGKDIPLHEIKRFVSGPAVRWLKDIDTHSFADTRFAVAGMLRSPEVRGVAGIRGERLAWKNIRLRSFEISVSFEHGNEHVSVHDASALIAESSYHDVSGKNNSIYKLMNARFIIPALLYKEPAVMVGNFQIRADHAGVYRNENEYYAEKTVLIKGSLDGNLTTRRFRVKDLALNTDFFKDISANIDITAGEQLTVDGVMKYNGFDIEKVSERFLHNFITEKGYAVSGKGTMNMTAHGVIPEKSSPRITGAAHMNITDAGFSSADGTKAAEGLRMNASVKFNTMQPFDVVDLSAAAEATNFELLIDKFYGSFKDKALSFSGSGTYVQSDSSVRISESNLKLTGIGEIHASGKVTGLAATPFFSMDLQVPGIDNRKAYDFFIRETFQAQVPLLSRLGVDGKSAVRLSLKGTPERFTAHGHIQVTDMNINEKGTTKAVSGIQMDLPVDIEYPAASLKKDEWPFGSLKVAGVSWAAVNLKNIELYPAIRMNTFVIKDDISIPIMGGDVILKNISYGDIFSAQRKLGLAADIKNLDLGRMSVAFELPRFSGSLSGAIPRIILEQDRLLTEGQVNLDIFGGNMKVDNLSMDNVFSPIASLKTDIELDGIHLEQLTGTFDFGNISGVIRGKIRDLVIVKGQAERFAASMESYKQKGVSQRISVEALKKISILGTGASPSILDRGIYRFFRDYRYDKLGFRASLKNDNLLLLGIENEGTKGYLVKGGFLPPKVDVINYTHNISFKEMVSRLKRIKQAER